MCNYIKKISAVPIQAAVVKFASVVQKWLGRNKFVHIKSHTVSKVNFPKYL